MIDYQKTLYVVLACLFIAMLMAIAAACKTSHIETFHGDKDSVNYYRHGDIEWRWKN